MNQYHPNYLSNRPPVMQLDDPDYGNAEFSDQDIFGENQKQAWQCEWYDDWSTYNARAHQVFTREICTELYTGAKKTFGGHYRPVTAAEANRRFPR